VSYLRNMAAMKKKILLFAAIILVAVAVVGYKILYKAHRDIKTEEAEFTLTATALSTEFSENEAAATARYADKTIVVSGAVTAYDAASETLTLDGILSATMLENVAVENASQVKVKGRFVGYDDLLGELKMDQVTLIE